MKRRLGCWVLALAVVLTMLPLEMLPVWADDPVEYTVSFESNGGGGTMAARTMPEGEYTLPECTFTPPQSNMEFDAWEIGDTRYAVGDHVTISADTTVKALWKIAVRTVSFDKNWNTATGEMADITVNRGADIQAPACGFTCTDRTFVSWNTAKNGTGTTYEAGGVIKKINNNMTLYAQWERNKITLHYDANASGVTMTRFPDQLKTPEEAIVLHAAIPEREDYIFLGWSTDKDATTAEFEPGTGFAKDEADEDGDGVITLYAVWKRKDITVTFNANGGLGSMEKQIFKLGVEGTLHACEFMRSTGEFLYWNTEADGSGTDYQDAQANVTFTENTILYAIWSPCITYRSNNGEGKKFVQPLPASTFTAIKANTFTREGHNFQSWNTKADGSGTTFQVKQSIMLGQTAGVVEKTELYAVWKPYSYSVRFVANGGVGTMEDQKFEYDKAQSLTANAFTRENRKFQGWSLTPGGKVQYKDKESVKDLSKTDGKVVLLYAVWDTNASTTDAAVGNVWIQQGGNIIGSVTPKDGDPYVFEVPAGIYNVVVTDGGRTKTVMVETDGGAVKGASVISPDSADSVLELKSGAPDVVVGNLDRVADDNRVTGAKTELKLTVERLEENRSDEQQNAIRARCPEGKSLEFLDLTLSKNVDGKTDGTFSGECSENLILRIPFTKAATKDITVYRWHNGAVSELSTRKQAEEYIEVETGAVTIYAKRFSTYAICYTPKDPAITYSNCPRNLSCPIFPFDDANASSWYHDGVHWAIEAGAMQGVTARRFYPNEPTTRAQLVTILWRLEGSPQGYYAYFDDVPDTAWYATAVGWAASYGIVEGQSAERFDPNATLTREQLATILYRYVRLKRQVAAMELVGLGEYPDAGSVSSWAREGLDWLTSYGVLDGVATSDGRRLLMPRESATRAQVATMMMRCWEYFLQ